LSRAGAGPIGVFDSGVGGLTVLKALRSALPAEHFIYLGDTARVPYGTKSAASVVRYSLQCADALMVRGIRCLVVACNTASASALEALRLRYPGIPIIGVIEPGAAAALAASRNRHIAVIGTEGTIGGGAYQTAIRRLDDRARIAVAACSLFVAMAEEGWVDGPLAEAVARRYLQPLFGACAVAAAAADSDADGGRHAVDGGTGAACMPAPLPAPDTLVLGCTHFPVLAGAIRAVLPAQVQIVDSAATVAVTVARELALPAQPRGKGTVAWLATDGAARFARVGSIFLGEALRPEQIEIIDL
jgi:glutamate racemase